MVRQWASWWIQPLMTVADSEVIFDVGPSKKMATRVPILIDSCRKAQPGGGACPWRRDMLAQNHGPALGAPPRGPRVRSREQGVFTHPRAPSLTQSPCFRGPGIAWRREAPLALRGLRRRGLYVMSTFWRERFQRFGGGFFEWYF
jgi:hypothetical protein